MPPISFNVTLVLIIVTCLVSYRAFSSQDMIRQFVLSPGTIKRNGEYYRFITHGFIHADFQHLLFNMYALYIFGGFVEMVFTQVFFNEVVGRVLYLLFYLSALVAASMVDYQRHQDNPAYSALGASGAVAAVIFVYVIFQPWAWFIFPPLPAIVFGIGYLAYSQYMDRQGRDNIGHNAHLWGGIYGIVVTVVLLVTQRPDLIDDLIAQLFSPTLPF